MPITEQQLADTEAQARERNCVHTLALVDEVRQLNQILEVASARIAQLTQALQDATRRAEIFGAEADSWRARYYAEATKSAHIPYY